MNNRDLGSYDRSIKVKRAHLREVFGGYRAIRGVKILSVFVVVPILTGFGN